MYAPKDEKGRKEVRVALLSDDEGGSGSGLSMVQEDIGVPPH